jgi:membrane protease YdiL (CAAX protease family)
MKTPYSPQAPSLTAFFALSMLVAWALWIPAASVPPASVTLGVRALLFLPGTFAPGIVAILLTAHAEGRKGIRLLLEPLFAWHVGARWYLFAFGYFAGVKLAAAAVHYAITGAWPAFGQMPVYLLLAASVFSTPFQAGEEIGWRGYALPRLAKRIGLAWASVLLGAIWAAWHLPHFFIPGLETTGQSFTVYLLTVTALSVAMAWLYAHTKGSLLLVMVMHAAINNTKDIVPSAVTDPANSFALGASMVSWLTCGMLWIGAAYFFARMRRPELALPDSNKHPGRPSAATPSD